MKWISKIVLFVVCMVSSTLYCQSQEVDFYQMIAHSKEQIKWDCARLIYLLVQDAILKVPERLAYITLHQQVQWVFDSAPMQEINEITNLLAPKAEMYAMAASIAREDDNEDAVLVLQIASEYARKGWFARHATLLTYTFGALCGYVGAYYVPANKDLLLSYMKIK